MKISMLIMLKKLITILMMISVNYIHSTAQSSKEVLDKMFVSIDLVKTLRFKLKKAERVDGEMKHGEQDVKFNRKPRKIYTYIHKPNEGVELLWLEGKLDGKAYINPNGFPYVNVTLDPYGTNMRKGNHHTVSEVGFDYISGIIKNVMEKCGDNFNEIFKHQGYVKFDNRECHKILIDYTPFKYVTYKAENKETITQIAYKNYVSDYMILEKNPHIESYQEDVSGKEITIPNAYARKTILYIDKETFLPLMQIMHDEKGLFEQYEFHNLRLNQKIAEEEFTKEYKDYSF